MRVPKPWTGIVTTQNENGYSIDVWGRTYTFKDSLFPASIVSQGKELLSAPISLQMDFGRGLEEPYGYRYEIHEATNERLIVNTAALSGNIIVNAAVTFEYDGFMKFAFRLVPCGKPEWNVIRTWRDDLGRNCDVMLRSAKIVIPLKKEAATLLHFWPAQTDAVVQNATVGSGAFGEMALPFKPSVWIGNENLGLNICMETDQEIQIADKNQFLTSRFTEDTNEVTIHLLDKTPRQWEGRVESWDRPLVPVIYEVMLEATPVRRVTRHDADDWRVAIGAVGRDDILEEAAKKGAKWIHFHEEWGMMQNYCIPANKEKMLSSIRKVHELGMKALPYFGYEYSTAMIDFEKHTDDYLNKSRDGYVTGGWTRSNLYQKEYIVCYKGGYSPVMIDACAKAMDELGFDGVYTDGTFIPWECANEAHGCGYRDENGVLHSTFPILATREHVKKLYEMVHAREGRLDAHQSACCVMPVLAFCDSYWDGENIQGAMAEDMVGTLSLEAFRAEFYGKNLGLHPQLITYLKEPNYTMRNALSLSSIHDVMPRVGVGKALDLISKIWKAYDEFPVAVAQWKPYWEKNCSVTSDNAEVYISAYEKKDGVLAFVAKFRGETCTETLKIPAGYTKAVELFDEKEYEIVDGAIQFEMAPVTSYMFLFK